MDIQVCLIRVPSGPVIPDAGPFETPSLGGEMDSDEESPENAMEIDDPPETDDLPVLGPHTVSIRRESR